MKIKEKRRLEGIKKYIGIVIIVFIVSCIVLRKYIFQGYYFLNDNNLTDIVRANVPWYYHMYDAIKKGGFFWSWQMGAGTTMLSHIDSIFDPFVYTLFIFGRDHILRMIVWMYVIKLICQALAFCAYIDFFNIDQKAAIVGSVMYAFTGYSMIMGSNFALGTVLVYLPLVLLGAEKFMKNGKWGLMCIALVLIALQSFFFFYITAIGLAVYVLFRMYFQGKFSLRKIIGFFGVGVLSIGVSAVSLFPQIELLMNSPRVSGTADYVVGKRMFFPQISAFFTALVRMVSNDALGNLSEKNYLGNTFFDNVDYFQLSLFAGTFFFYFIGVILYQMEKKKKIIIILFSVFCMAFPIVSYVTNGFSTVSARWMYFISFVQCVVIARTIDIIIKEKKFYSGIYITSFISVFLLMYVGCIAIHTSGKFGDRVVELFNTVTPKMVFVLCLYMIPLIIRLLCYLSKEKIPYQKFGLLLCILIIIIDVNYNYKTWYLSDYSVCDYSESNNMNYLDKSSILIADLLPKKNEFYRINKSFDSVMTGPIPSENDAMVQGYYGLKNYNSLGNSSYINFLQTSGCYCTLPFMIDEYKKRGLKPKDIVGSDLNYINGVEQRYALMSYLGVRYYITRGEEEVPDYFDIARIDGDMITYENRYVMPIMFSNKELMSLSDFEKLNNTQKERALLFYTIIDSEENKVDSIPGYNEVFNNVKYQKDKIQIVSFDNDSLVVEIMINDGEQYVSTTIPYDRNWDISVDGENVSSEVVNAGFVGFKVSPGRHYVKLTYRVKSMIQGVWTSIASVIVGIFIIVVNRFRKKKVVECKE